VSAPRRAAGPAGALEPADGGPRAVAALLRPGARWLGLYWATGVVTFTASILYLGLPAPRAGGIPLLGALARASVSAGFWTAACLLGLAVALLRPRAGRAGTVARCALATVLIALLFTAQASLYCRLGWTGCTDPWGLALASLPPWLLLGTSLVCVGLAFAAAAGWRGQEIRTDRLSADLLHAQLDALALQLRPHFLFNTLQSIATLMHRDVAAAREMLARLALLLERSTRAAEAQELPLGQELELLRLYTDIESVRFGDRLRVEVAVAPGAAGALVPHLLLQPLVENAVRHAVERVGAGRIEVRAETGGEPPVLALEVRDNGAGLPPGYDGGAEGVGLANTRARLHALYGARHRFELESRPGEGLTVRIRIPLRHTTDGSAG